MQTLENKIDQLQGLWVELMEKYKGLVSAHGMGYNIPKEESQTATELMNHAENIRKQISKLKADAGIKEAPVSKESNVKRIDLKGKNYAWAVYMLAKILGVPRLFIKSQALGHSAIFIHSNERSRKLRLKIADDKRYQDWFEGRYKVGLLFCIQSLQQSAAPACQTKRFEWAAKTLLGFTNQESNQRAYCYFKQKYFDDGINQEV